MGLFAHDSESTTGGFTSRARITLVLAAAASNLRADVMRFKRDAERAMNQARSREALAEQVRVTREREVLRVPPPRQEGVGRVVLHRRARCSLPYRYSFYQGEGW